MNRIIVPILALALFIPAMAQEKKAGRRQVDAKVAEKKCECKPGECGCKEGKCTCKPGECTCKGCKNTKVRKVHRHGDGKEHGHEGDQGHKH